MNLNLWCTRVHVNIQNTDSDIKGLYTWHYLCCTGASHKAYWYLCHLGLPTDSHLAVLIIADFMNSWQYMLYVLVICNNMHLLSYIAVSTAENITKDILYYYNKNAECWNHLNFAQMQNLAKACPAIILCNIYFILSPQSLYPGSSCVDSVVSNGGARCSPDRTHDHHWGQRRQPTGPAGALNIIVTEAETRKNDEEVPLFISCFNYFTS